MAFERVKNWMQWQRRLTAQEIGEQGQALVKFIDEGNTLLDAEAQMAPRFNRNDWTLIQDRAVSSLRRIDGIELPDTGRSSVDGSPLSDRIASSIGATGSFSPQIDFQMLALLKQLGTTNPDFSQYISNIINLGNSGHELIVNTPTSAKAEAAVNRLNESASRIYARGAGVDGLFNAYFRQAAWSGAISSEDVVDFAGRRVKEVVTVPVEQIRFLYIDGEYVAFQRPSVFFAGMDSSGPLGLVRLNPNTYQYFALQTLENSPYALPPATASVQAIIGPQADMLDNVKFIAKKLGILGLVSVACTPPPRKPNEAEHEYRARAKKYLSDVREVLEENFNQGLLVTYRDQKVDHSNVASDARGAYDIFKLNEEQVFSGFAMPPAFFGRVYSTTETFADVVWGLLVSQVGNFQRLVKRRQEQTYRLDLLLAGIEADSVTVAFNRTHSRDPQKDAEAERIRTQTAILKARAGIISPDQAAQELGYEAAFDPELLSTAPEGATALQRIKVGAGNAQQRTLARFQFNRAAQSYRYVPTRLEIASAIEVEGRDVTGNMLTGKVVNLEKKKRVA